MENEVTIDVDKTIKMSVQDVAVMWQATGQ